MVDRLKVISGLSCVDLIIPFSEENPISLIKEIKPDIYVKGNDYSREEIIGADLIDKYGGEIILLPILEHISTTKIINRIENGEK